MEFGTPEWQQAHFKKEFEAIKRTMRFLPHVRVEYCPNCPAYTDGNAVFLIAKDLTEHPLLRCSSDWCKGRCEQLSRGQLRRMKQDNRMSKFAQEIWAIHLNNHFRVDAKPNMKNFSAEQVAQLFFEMKEELQATRKVTNGSETGRHILNKALEEAAISGDFHPFIAMPPVGKDELGLRTLFILSVLADPSRANETITSVPRDAPEHVQQMLVILYTLALFENSTSGV